MLAEKNPTKAFEELYESDTLWSVLDKISRKYPKVADGFLRSMIYLDKVGDTKAAKVINCIVEFFGKVTSPVQAFLEKYGVQDALKSSKVLNFLGKGAEVTKFVGKAGTVATFASLAFTGVSSGITEGIKEKSIGKGVIGGTIETVKSVGPLEGMAVGATIGTCICPGAGTVIGTGVGAVVGLVNKGVQFKWPRAYDSLKDGAYKLYDYTGQELNTIKKADINFIKDPVKEVSKFIPGLSKIRFGW